MKIYLLDDHAIVRNGLRTILNTVSHFDVIDDSGDVDIFLKRLPQLVIDLFIIDLSLQQKSGFDILKEIKKYFPHSKVIILSMHDSPNYIDKAKELGADGFLSKKLDSNELLKEIIEVSLGRPSFGKNFLGQTDDTHPLTLREKEILVFISKGKSSKEIATFLNISQRTVEAHRFNIARKMGTANMSEAVAKFINSNKIDL